MYVCVCMVYVWASVPFRTCPSNFRVLQLWHLQHVRQIERDRDRERERVWHRERESSPGKVCFESFAASASALLPVYNQHMFEPNWLERGERERLQGVEVGMGYEGLPSAMWVCVSFAVLSFRAGPQPLKVSSSGEKWKRKRKWDPKMRRTPSSAFVWELKAVLSTIRKQKKAIFIGLTIENF